MFLFLVYHWLAVGQILDTQNPRNSTEFRGPSQFNDFKLRFGLHTHSRGLVDASTQLTGAGIALPNQLASHVTMRRIIRACIDLTFEISIDTMRREAKH